MENLYYEATDFTPEIGMQQQEGKIAIRGKSYPENTFKFYQPMMEWLNQFFVDENSPKKLAVCFDLIYFNSSSAKQLFDFFHVLDKYNHQFDIRIQWRYDTDNESVLEEGEGLIDDFPGLAIDLVVKTSA